MLSLLPSQSVPSLYCCKGLFLPKVIPCFCPWISYGSAFAWLNYLRKKVNYPVRVLCSVACIRISFICRLSSEKNTINARIPVTVDSKQRLYFIGKSPTSGRHPAASRAALVGNASNPSAKVETKAVQIFIAFRSYKQECSISLVLYPKRPHIELQGMWFFLPSLNVNSSIFYPVISTSQLFVLESYQLACSTSAVQAVCP